MTSKQIKDLETIEFFIPECLESISITENDRERFLEYSEKGMHKSEAHTGAFTQEQNGFTALCEGKRWRGIHIHELYEKGVLDGSMPYVVLLKDMPIAVVDFLKKEMFGGIDAEIIEKAYLSTKVL